MSKTSAERDLVIREPDSEKGSCLGGYHTPSKILAGLSPSVERG